MAARRLDAFDAGPWGTKYPPIEALWRRTWEQVTPCSEFTPDIRKIIYTNGRPT